MESNLQKLCKNFKKCLGKNVKMFTTDFQMVQKMQMQQIVTIGETR